MVNKRLPFYVGTRKLTQVRQVFSNSGEFLFWERVPHWLLAFRNAPTDRGKRARR